MEAIEIPFGAKDSEFIKDEYLIPEGCKARIEGNKVIIEKIQKEDELTEFEKELNRIVITFSDAHAYMDKNEIHHYSKGLLDLARMQLKQEMTEIQLEDTKAYQEGVKEGRRLERQDIDKELDEAYKSRDEVVYFEGYDQGKEDTLKDLLKWKKATKDKDFDRHVLLLEDDRVVIASCVYKDEYYIELDDLKTLPKEE